MQKDVRLQSANGRLRKPLKSSPAVLEAVASQQGPVNVPDILQFACGGYYCMEGETSVTVKVERLGNPDGYASVEYYTEDGSAQAGIKYKSARGVAKFAPQQTDTEIHIELIEDDNFDTVLEFNVFLKNAKGAALDTYLSKCEITIADDDAFPTNKFKAYLSPNHHHQSMSESLLMTEYIRMHMQEKVLRWAAIRTIFFDQIENLETLWNLLLTRYLIDCFFLNRSTYEGGFMLLFRWLEHFPKHLQIQILALLLVIPNPIKWVLRRLKAHRRMGGMSRRRLQESLVRKFLNYSEASRSQMSNADLTMAITRDVPQLVQDGLLMIFPIMQKMSLLVMFGVLAVDSIGGGILFAAFPVLMILFLRARLARTELATSALFESQTKMVGFVQHVADFFRIIADYGQKQETVGTFHALVAITNDKKHTCICRQVTNFEFAPFLTSVFVALYILMVYQEVLSDDGMGIGEFVTGVGIWKAVGGCYQGIYENLLIMQESVSSLHNIVYYLNLPLDISDRKNTMCNLLEELDKAQDASSALFYEGKATNCSLVQTSPDIVSGDIVERASYSQDLIQIDCQNVTFCWERRESTFFHPQVYILRNASFEVSQGSLVGVTGGAGSGKATLLHLLAGIIVPKAGSGLFFVPPHLRVLHVTLDPIYFHDQSLWENLLYGEVSEEDGDPSRVVQICRLMGMSDETLAAVEGGRQKSEEPEKASDEHVCGTGQSVASRNYAESRCRAAASISHKDRCLIHLARAMIVNPDLLIVHEPLTQYHGLDLHRVLEVFRTFVDMRGLEKSLPERQQRRPRTCIMSLESMEGIETFDLVLSVCDGVVQELNLQSVEDLQHKTDVVLMQMDANGHGQVDREEFMEMVARERDVAELFAIPDAALNGSNEDCKRALGVAFDKEFLGARTMGVDDLEAVLHQKVQDQALTKQGSRQTMERQVSEGRTSAPDEGPSTSDTLSKRLADVPTGALGLTAVSLMARPGSRAVFRAA